MDKFADIRPYNDDEARPIIDSIIADDEFIDSILALTLRGLPAFIKNAVRPILRWFLKRQVRNVHNVHDFQLKVEGYCKTMIARTMNGYTVSGLENLDLSQAYTFVSNHRDITLDPAMVNYVLHSHGSKTVRIAIGDNLLTKEFASHLMRINKSFIVKRSSKGPRELLAILKHLSEYISFSVKEDKHPVWIAQREGRAKDGLDKTEAAIIKMLVLANRKLGMTEAIKTLNIVPVSISYEFDPCDAMKANELSSVDKNGQYEKAEQEDIASIAKGISGYKGRVHLHFGQALDQAFDDADEVAGQIDKVIVDGYVLQPSNYFAYYALYGEYPKGIYSGQRLSFNAQTLSQDKLIFDKHMAAIDEPLKPYVLAAYANPIVNKKAMGFM